VRRIDPTTGRLTGDIEGSLANVTPDAVWVVANGPPNGRVLRISPTTLRRIGPILGLEILPAVVGVAGREVWVGKYFQYCDPRNHSRSALATPTSVGWFRVDPATLRALSSPVHIGPYLSTPAFAAGAFWITSDGGDDLIRIDLAVAARARR
jgi:hypothetical protein